MKKLKLKKISVSSLKCLTGKGVDVEGCIGCAQMRNGDWVCWGCKPIPK
ncbi:MAG TPA: hypothetical protein VD993_19030 [Chitinophagaceae bacterium]|nr:hypothetical protein [Chitinophagaceae bacterium]